MLGRTSRRYVSINLPPPVSVNDLWKPGRRGDHVTIIRSPKYNAWFSEAGYMLNSQRPGMVEGPYALTIKVTAASKIDLGNVEKAVSDLLQAHGVIENDRLAQKITIERADNEGMLITVVGVNARD
jgi:Holliday junction resolvase RusA-like endonuclease